MVKVCVPARSFLISKFSDRVKLTFLILEDVLLLIMMCSKMLNHINVSSCSVGTQFTLFFQTHKLNQHSYFMAYQTGLCSKVTCIHNDLALFVSLFWFLKWFGLRYSFISFWDFVMWSHFSSAIFTSKLNSKAFQLHSWTFH